MTGKDSPVLQFMQIAWDNAQRGTSHSWLRLNQGLRAALFLTVEMGFEWENGDYNEAMKRFNGGYWIGAEGFEMLYRTAVLYRNASAWQCLEAHANRKPFILKGARLHIHGNMGNGLARLVVGADFLWNGERVTVTSFNDEKGQVLACSYGKDSRKVKAVYKITHADLKAAKKAKS
jgi:hypothetical protein